MSNRKLKKSKSKLLVLFILCVLSIILAFIFLSCGKGPQLKVQDPEAGQFAIDFSEAPPDTGTIDEISYISLTQEKNPISLANTNITIEGWVMTKKPAGQKRVSGLIFGRMHDDLGIMLYVSTPNFSKQSRPRVYFAMKTLDLKGTVNDVIYIHQSAATILTDRTWTHVAAVLVEENHSPVPGHPQCADKLGNPTGGEAEMPHVDQFINGVLIFCGSVGEEFAPALTTRGKSFFPQQIGSSLVANNSWAGTWLNNLERFDAVVDEIRLWTVARTPSQIQECMTQELSITSGTCGIDSNLKGYWKFNEGKGKIAYDHSGSGHNGAKIYCDFDCDSSLGAPTAIDWTGGWATGYPFP